MKNSSKQEPDDGSLPVSILLVFSGGIIIDKQGKTIAATDTLARAKAAAEYMESVGRNKVSCICCTGGYFVSGQKHPASAVLLGCMRQNMRQPELMDSIPVVLEQRSVDTFQNIEFSLQDLGSKLDGKFDPKKGLGLTIVSHPTHLRRIKLTLAAHGILPESVHELPVYYHLSPVQHLMELAFYLIHKFDPKGQGFIARWNQRRRAQSYLI